MSKLPAGLIVFAIILLTLITGIFMVYSATSSQSLMGRTHAIATPIRSMRVTIGENDQDQFVAHLQAFADANGFTLLISQVAPDKRDINIELMRKDMDIGASNPFSPGEFKIYFYNNFRDGAEPPTINTLNAIIDNLRQFIPGLEDDPRSR